MTDDYKRSRYLETQRNGGRKRELRIGRSDSSCHSKKPDSITQLSNYSITKSLPPFPPFLRVSRFFVKEVKESSSQTPTAPVPPPDQPCGCVHQSLGSPRRSQSSSCGRGRR